MLPETELNFGMKCVKLMLFVANLMFVLIGFLLLTIGLTIKSIYSNFDHFLVNHYYDASKLAIAVGIIIFFVAFFGCVGALKQSVCLINVYALLLFLVLMMEIAISIVASTMRYNLTDIVRKEMTESMKFYNADSGYLWDSTQYNIQCCGVVGPHDWDEYSTEFNLTKVPRLLMDSRSDDLLSSNIAENVTVYDVQIAFRVPTTCCINESCESQHSVYSEGCLIAITYIINECALLLGIGALCIAFIQILGIIFANLLAKSVRKLKTQIEVERSERRQHIYEQLANAANSKQKVSPVLYTPTSSEA
uniref:Tetraspanin n=1 Tax=Chrysomela tremula TaxID=63687 RepID=C3UTC3_CHRTR|nr:tetraspanin 1 [Chrysomela tremula]